MRKHGNSKERQFEPAAANGILNRRAFLEGTLVAAAAGAGVVEAQAEPLAVPNSMKEPGAGFTGYGQPSRFESKVHSPCFLGSFPAATSHAWMRRRIGVSSRRRMTTSMKRGTT